jgi:hypothetical protein
MPVLPVGASEKLVGLSEPENPEVADWWMIRTSFWADASGCCEMGFSSLGKYQTQLSDAGRKA